MTWARVRQAAAAFLERLGLEAHHLTPAEEAAIRAAAGEGGPIEVGGVTYVPIVVPCHMGLTPIVYDPPTNLH